jgi:hypothetical protein
VVTVGSLLAIAITPSYAILFAVYNFSRLLLPIKLVLVSPLPFFAPLLLLALGRHLAAKVLLALLLTTALTMFAYFYSADSGVQHFLFAFALIAFLIFDKSERSFLIFLLRSRRRFTFIRRTTLPKSIRPRTLTGLCWKFFSPSTLPRLFCHLRHYLHLLQPRPTRGGTSDTVFERGLGIPGFVPGRQPEERR